MIPPLHTVERGQGPELVLVHGTATDSDGFVSLFAHGAKDSTLFAYDRRGTPRSPLPEHRETWSVEDHARDLQSILLNRLSRRDSSVDPSGRRAWVYGSSFGAVVVLELARSRPDLFHGVLLGEPPLPPKDGAPPVPARFFDELMDLRRTERPEAAGHFFLQQILSVPEYQRMPRMWRDRAASFHESIALECAALMDHAPRFSELGTLQLPVLLLEGSRSGPDFPPVLDELERVLPRVERVRIEGAGHMMHADQPRRFLAAVRAFMDG